jgi:hypothetical protein
VVPALPVVPPAPVIGGDSDGEQARVRRAIVARMELRMG